MTSRAALVFGLSEAASAAAIRLRRDGWRVALTAAAPPKVHRRRMSFADVWWDGFAALGDATCVRVAPERVAAQTCPPDAIPFLALGTAEALALLPWAVAVDARLAKRSAPLRLRGRATLAIGCGPGHVAGDTCDLAIETQWGERLGAVIETGPTAALAGEPRAIDGVGRERIVYAPVAGRLQVLRDIGEAVAAGETVARVGETEIAAPIGGALRGMLRDGLEVERGDKLLEVDPRPPRLAIFAGVGERPAMIAEGVARALARSLPSRAVVRPSSAPVPELSTPLST